MLLDNLLMFYLGALIMALVLVGFVYYQDRKHKQH